MLSEHICLKLRHSVVKNKIKINTLFTLSGMALPLL